MTTSATAKDTTYNGWKNRATWNVMLWLDNDQTSYDYYVSRVKLLKGKITGVVAKAIATSALGETTGDGISLGNRTIDWKAIADAMKESYQA